ncbi:hypothetical protein O1L44_00460 [Streptomyces noursei]|uniref:hypothetical protein n=1 Tax=Streptomyces noursei TaxID=1971 RepID=UPI00081C8E32|nr:hypothetical protein SNOUR_05640 [Streptomyces noursei ATCC 11455]MCZ0991915.1 hypothetical protein [Streptomyces noursei]
MSALADRLHAFLGRFTSATHKDVEGLVAAIEQHLVPVIRGAVHDALTTAEADGRSLLDQLRADEGRLAQAVAAEVAQILGHTTTPPGGAA